VQSARVMSQSMPWIAEETGIFRKYNLEFPLVYVGTSPLATAAMLGGDAQLMIDGGVGVVALTWPATVIWCLSRESKIILRRAFSPSRTDRRNVLCLIKSSGVIFQF
jgi:hypothetical protein